MSVTERGINPEFSKENIDWSPSVTILPHHLFQNDEIGEAFRGTVNPDLSTFLTIAFYQGLRKTSGDPDGYVKDVVGKTKKEAIAFKNNNIAFLRQINDLPENSTSHITFPVDGLCKGCAVGAHCTATNVLMIDQLGNWELQNSLKIEMNYIKILRQRLEDNSFSEGTDYKKLDIYSTLVDFEGNPLNNPPKNPKLIPVEFPSLLVKTTALRALFGRVDSSPNQITIG